MNSGSVGADLESTDRVEAVGELLVADWRWGYEAEARRADQADTLTGALIAAGVAAGALLPPLLQGRHLTDSGQLALLVVVAALALSVIFALATRLTVRGPLRAGAGPRTVRPGVVLQITQERSYYGDEVWPLSTERPVLALPAVRHLLCQRWRDRVEAAGAVAHSKTRTVELSVLCLLLAGVAAIVMLLGSPS